MSGLIEINVEEERGFVAVSTDVDRLAVVLGVSSEGSGLSSFYLSGAAAIAARGYGDGVDALTQIIEQRQSSGSAKKYPAAMYTLPEDAPGTYGAIDDSGVTGLATVTAGSETPLGTYEARLKWITGGTVGTAGMWIQWSLNGGRKWSRTTALGTATSFEIPNSGVEFDFAPSGVDLTALNTLLNEIATDYEAHRVVIAGSVHGAADNTNAVTAAAASDTATRVALANDLRAMYSAHRILTSGGVHGAADATNVITAPVATDDSSALVLALDLKAKYNAHHILTAGAVHGLADPGNTTAAAAPAAGTFNAGDEVGMRTFAPTVAGDDVADAFEALAVASINFAIVVLDCDCDATMLDVVTTGLNALAARGKRVVVLTRSRLPDFESSETEETWGTDVAADMVNYDDSRIHVRTTYGLLTDAMTSRQYLRSDLAQFAADVVRVGRKGAPTPWPCSPADRPTPNFSLVDSTGATIGHDEGPRGAYTGLSNETLGNRFGCQQRLPDPDRLEEVFNTVPWVLYASDEQIHTLMDRRLANAMERVAVAAGTPTAGATVSFVSTGPTSGTLTAAGRNAVQSSIYQALKSEFSSEIDNADDAAVDSGLVQVNPAVTVSGGNLLGVSVRLAPKIKGYVRALDILLSLQG